MAAGVACYPGGLVRGLKSKTSGASRRYLQTGRSPLFSDQWRPMAYFLPGCRAPAGGAGSPSAIPFCLKARGLKGSPEPLERCR